MTRSACRLLLLLSTLGSGPSAGAQTPEAAVLVKARAIHERVITLDTHDDIATTRSGSTRR
jgi:hypothetical protein